MFGIDSKFYEVVSKIADLVILNLIFVLCSLPIITIGASTTALYGVTKKMAGNREGYIFRNFFQLFKENFRQSTVMWIILLVAAMIPTIDLYIINSLKKTVMTTALQSTFENTVKNTLKNALLMGIGHFPWTLIILLITLLPIILIVLLGKTAGSVVYVMLFIGFAVLAYLNSYIFNHIFKKYM